MAYIFRKPLLQFVYKFKGVDKTALCTDAMRSGMPDGESILGSLNNGQKVIIEDGVVKCRIGKLLPVVLQQPTDWFEP